MKETLYQLNQKGQVKVWIIEAKDLGKFGAEYTISSGLVSGAHVHNTTRVLEGKNIGKANETSPWTQTLAEANAKVELKIREGYARDISKITGSDVLGSGTPQPMLAQKHSPDGSQSSSKTLKQIGILDKKIIVQPKLDGNRCLVIVKHGKAQMYTRKGDLMKVQLAHILADVELLAGNEDIILDGELFSDQISFNSLNGLIKRVTVTDGDISKRLLIKYNLYDTISANGYEFRKEAIKKFATHNIIVVPSYEIVATDENVKNWLERFLSEGHEGLMIRQLGIPYEHKRTWQLCKVKVFEDSEFKLVDFDEDARGGFVGAFIMQDKAGNMFGAGASGQSVEERTFMWENRGNYIGKMATVEYFGMSEYGIPRFPKFKGTA